MNQRKKDIVNRALDYAKERFHGDCTGHDFYHTERVLKTALKIWKEEGGDEFVISLSAILHDVDDYKLVKEKKTDDPYKNAKSFLDDEDIADDVKEQIIQNIGSVSFKGSETETPKTIEGKIVQDADRLDALGAIGIARCFAYGGHKDSPIYDPTIKPVLDMDFETYKSHRGSSINHFYEKLFKLKDLMNTSSARKLAEERDAFMKSYLNEFYGEWEGTK